MMASHEARLPAVPLPCTARVDDRLLGLDILESGVSQPTADGGSADGEPGATDGSSEGGGLGVVTHVSAATEATDIVGSGDTAYFAGVEAGGEGAIFSAKTTMPAATVLCKAGANRVLSALAIDGATLYAIRPEPATGKAVIVKTTTSGTGAACEEIATITANPLTELAKVAGSLVYLGAEKVMRVPVAGGAESELLTTAATGFVGDFAALGTMGFVVDTSTAGTPGARLVRFKLDGSSETYTTFDSPQDSAYEVLGANVVVWATPGPNVGDFVFKQALATAPLASIAPTTVVTSNFGIGSVLRFCRTDATYPSDLAVASFDAQTVAYHQVGFAFGPTRKLASLDSVMSPDACALATGALWGIDPTDKRVFRAAR